VLWCSRVNKRNGIFANLRFSEDLANCWGELRLKLPMRWNLALEVLAIVAWAFVVGLAWNSHMAAAITNPVNLPGCHRLASVFFDAVRTAHFVHGRRQCASGPSPARSDGSNEPRRLQSYFLGEAPVVAHEQLATAMSISEIGILRPISSPPRWQRAVVKP
jgi:hypothetical protein